MITSSVALVLMVLLIVKHFIVDFPLQTAYMLGKSKKEGWVRPLFAHSSVHAVLTLAVLFGGLLAVLPWGLALGIGIAFALFDGIVHFVVDMIKAQGFSHYSTSENKFWIALGADQMAHYLTYAFIVFMLI